MSPPRAVRDYVLDPNDPRAPTSEQWLRMTPAERRSVIDALPSEVPVHVFAPEGDPHRKAKSGSLGALEGHFQRTGRKVYVSSELAVYYPGEPRIVPDVLAVLDVAPGDRTRWVVQDEGKGIDFVLEVHVAGDRRKDHEEHVETYARLGIGEYFLFDRGRLRLHGWRLPAPEARSYRPVIAQQGRYASHMLGLDLILDGSKLRFFYGSAPLLEADELMAKLGGMLDDVIAHKEEAERRADELSTRLAEEQKLRAEEQKLRAEEQKLRADAEQRLAEALAEIDRLRRGR